jgi:hypothetical protein
MLCPTCKKTCFVLLYTTHKTTNEGLLNIHTYHCVTCNKNFIIEERATQILNTVSKNNEQSKVNLNTEEPKANSFALSPVMPISLEEQLKTVQLLADLAKILDAYRAPNINRANEVKSVERFLIENIGPETIQPESKKQKTDSDSQLDDILKGHAPKGNISKDNIQKDDTQKEIPKNNTQKEIPNLSEDTSKDNIISDTSTNLILDPIVEIPNTENTKSVPIATKQKSAKTKKSINTITEDAEQSTEKNLKKILKKSSKRTLNKELKNLEIYHEKDVNDVKKVANNKSQKKSNPKIQGKIQEKNQKQNPKKRKFDEIAYELPDVDDIQLQIIKTFQQKAEVFNSKKVKEVNKKIVEVFKSNFKIVLGSECLCSRVVLDSNFFRNLWKLTSSGSFSDFVEYWQLEIHYDLGVNYDLLITVGTITSNNLTYSTKYKEKEMYKLRHTNNPIILILTYNPDLIGLRIIKTDPDNFRENKEELMDEIIQIH